MLTQNIHQIHMRNLLLTLLVFSTFAFGQNEYQFTTVVDLNPTPVCDQGRTGTCWSFSTISFLESEVKRINGKDIDLSEMYIVRNTYPAKAYNYVYRSGKAQFGEGGLAHDVIDAVRVGGVVPQSEYTGFVKDAERYDHSIMFQRLKGYLNNIIEFPKAFMHENWKDEFGSILDEYMGEKPKTFVYEGKTYTPQQFAKHLKINPEDYVSVSSFTNEPYYETFVLSIPDNFSNGSFYNLPLDEYMDLMTSAVHAGFTISFSSDVSEAGFSSKHGMAILPAEGEKEDYFKTILPEKWVDAAERQKAFEDFSTVDDHLMQITGIVKDQLGNLYFDVKNSWGTKNLGNEGHVYMSFPFVRMKSVAFMVHKDALSKELKNKLGIK